MTLETIPEEISAIISEYWVARANEELNNRPCKDVTEWKYWQGRRLGIEDSLGILGYRYNITKEEFERVE
jgi:hypothetical protein